MKRVACTVNPSRHSLKVTVAPSIYTSEPSPQVMLLDDRIKCLFEGIDLIVRGCIGIPLKQ